MVFYETTYILHSALQEGRLNDIISVIENKIKSLGANIVYSDNWGRKKLAYMINKEKYGTYIFVQFSLKDSDKLKELSAEFEHNPNVLRYLNIRIEEEDLMEPKQQDKQEKETKKTEAPVVEDKLDDSNNTAVEEKK
jgi:small subunit ribosomal protein S6